MPSSGILLRVALLRTDVSEDRSASIIMVTKIVTANVPSSPIFVILMMEALFRNVCSYKSHKA
jgi:hypothetical protein